MRPYLAILVDSLREAMHSRVLWVVLLCITLFFLVVAPASLKEHTTTGLQEYDILSTTDLARRLIEAGAAEGDRTSPAKYVWQQLDADLHRRLPKLLEQRSGEEQGLEEMVEGAEIKKDLLKALDKQIKEPDWNEAEPLQKVRLRREGRPLAEKQKKGEKLTDDERKRLNRLVLEAIFPESIAVSPAKSTTLAYFYFFDSGQQLPVSRDDIKGWLPGLVVQIMDWLFGIFGILAAMLVTASIVPQMFEPGSLHLLLSKPVSRSALFLTKFLGGCAFAMLSSAYFAVGLWLIVGTRFGVWDSRLLAAVPAYTFVFAIYYSVTSLAGLVFRNTIVAMVMGMLFWAICFFVGSVKVWGVDPFVMEVNRIRRVVPAGDDVIAVAPLAVSQWDGEERQWRAIFKSQEEGPEFFSQTFPLFGPFYDAEHDQLVSVQRGGLGTDVTVSVAPRSQLWPRTRGSALPSGAVAMLADRESRFVVVTLEGIYRSKQNVGQTGRGSKVLGFELPWGSSGGFEQVSEGTWSHVSQPLLAAIDPQSDRVAIYSRGRISIWKAGDSGKFIEHATRDFGEEEEKTEMLVAIAGNRVLLAPTDGRVLALDAETLKTEAEFKTELDKPVRQLRASPDARRIAVLLSHGRLWTFDPADDKLARADVSHQGTISAVAYDPSGRLLLAHDVNRVSRWDEESDSLEPLCRPKLTPTETAAYYVAIPLYNILPKPGEVDRTLIHLMTGEKATSQADANRSGDVQFTAYVDPWQPVWSSALFMAVMLAIGCIYMERMEF